VNDETLEIGSVEDEPAFDVDGCELPIFLVQVVVVLIL
jgi:hypothetical protein